LGAAPEIELNEGVEVKRIVIVSEDRGDSDPRTADPPLGHAGGKHAAPVAYGEARFRAELNPTNAAYPAGQPTWRLKKSASQWSGFRPIGTGAEVETNFAQTAYGPGEYMR
jgi:hypothetical protein